jgi:hypothetical protein
VPCCQFSQTVRLGGMYHKYRPDRINGQCLVCDEKALTSVSTAGDCHEFICRRCGAYRVSEEFIWEMPEADNPLRKFRYRISWVFRNAAEKIEDIRALPIHRRSELLPLLETRDPSVEEKLGALLAFLARNSDGPGKYSDFDCAFDHSLVCAQDEDEAVFLFDSLFQQGLIELAHQSLDSPAHGYRLSASGWSELSRREKSGAESDNVFIAMPFDFAGTATGDAIWTAVKATDHVPLRMDLVEHTNRIDDEILSRLRSSKFLIADLTQQNPGTYFEAGFMLGLGRPVIWICSQEDLENVHFDARQYNIVDYADHEDLRKRLQFRIEAVIGRGSAVRTDRVTGVL